MIGSFITTTHPLMGHISCRFLWQNVKSPRRLSPPQARFGTLWLLDFPNTKITFEKGQIFDHWWDSRKYDRTADGDRENCVRSQSAYFEGEWGVIVLCTMFPISSSINASIFQIAWLDTFWTDLVHQQITVSTLENLYILEKKYKHMHSNFKVKMEGWKHVFSSVRTW